MKYKQNMIDFNTHSGCVFNLIRFYQYNTATGKVSQEKNSCMFSAIITTVHAQFINSS